MHNQLKHFTAVHIIMKKLITLETDNYLTVPIDSNQQFQTLS